MSATTAMIDVTATMLPRTVMNDRSFAAQMAWRAMPADSKRVFMTRGLPRGRRLDLHRIGVEQSAHRVVRPRDDLIARLQAREHLEVAIARDPHLDGHVLHDAGSDDEHALGLLPCLAREQF